MSRPSRGNCSTNTPTWRHASASDSRASIPLALSDGYKPNASGSSWRHWAKAAAATPKDDPVLATALAARARYLVAGDRDLLVLEKPFGIEIVSPAEFLSRTEPKG
jgi:hypothetical protein